MAHDKAHKKADAHADEHSPADVHGGGIPEAKKHHHQDPTIVASAQEVFGFGRGLLLAFVALILLGTCARYLKRDTSVQATKQTQNVQAPVVTQPAAPVVHQLHDCFTNPECVIDVKEITDVYTDGEPIRALPPGWEKSQAVKYSGHGRLTLQGGNIHAGKWTFWADDGKVVLVRVFGIQQ